MAYDPKAENLRHLQRVATGLFDFHGRSQRTEFVAFLCFGVAALPVIFVFGLILFNSARLPYDQYLHFAFWVAAIPLFVRRLHDQDRNGWWAVVLPILLGLKAYEQVQFEAGNIPNPSLGFPYNLAELILVLAFWLFVFWPGTEGENRFGLDPRQDVLAVR